MKILICSDFHGNEEHIEKIADAVQSTHPDVFVYLGDFSPNRFDYQTPDTIITFLEEKFFSCIANTPVKYKYVMPGNTDYLIVVNHFKQKYNNPEVCQVVADSQITIADKNIVFLSSVSYSPHCYKDNERLNKFKKKDDETSWCFETSQIFTRDDILQESNIVKASDTLQYDTKYFHIFKNYEQIHKKFKDQLNHTIYDILDELLVQCDAQNKNIILSHGPPFQTNADIYSNTSQKNHVGSVDIRKIIEKWQPDACISGHIHQSVFVSGTHKDNIGESKIYSVGNTGVDHILYKQVHFLLYDTDTKQCERITYEVNGNIKQKLRPSLD